MSSPTFFPLPAADANGSVTVLLPGKSAKLAQVGILGTADVLASLSVPAHARANEVLVSTLLPANAADINVSIGGPEVNDDYTVNYGAQVQAQFDKAGVQTLTFDKGALGSNAGNTPFVLSSGQELAAADAKHGLLAANKGYALLTNRNRTYDPAAIVDHNMGITGGSWNARGNQIKSVANGWPNAVRLVGHRNTLFQDATFGGAGTFCLHSFNSVNFIIRRCTFAAIPGVKNTDGIHQNGPLYNFLAEYVTFVNTQDDAIAFNGSADPIIHDLAYAFGQPDSAVTLYNGFNQYGGQKKMVVRHVTFQGECWRGQRMLAEGYVLEDGQFSDYNGTTHGYWLIADNYNGNNVSREPYLKDLHWDDISLTVLLEASNEVSNVGEVLWRADSDNISITNRRRTDFTYLKPTCLWQGFRHTTVSWDGYTATDTDPNSQYVVPHLQFEHFYFASPQTLHIDTLTVRNIRHTRTAAAGAGTTIVSLEGGTIGVVDCTGSSCQNVQSFLQLNEMTVDTVILSATTRTGTVDPASRLICLGSNGRIGTLKAIGYPASTTLADLVYGPGAANVTSLQLS